MMALSRKMLEQVPGEIELLLPWYATGTLSARDSKRVEDALARDPELGRQYAAIRQDHAETIALNENLGAPSIRAMQKLFAAIDAEPAQAASPPRGLAAGLLFFFDALSPRVLAWSAGLAALLVLAQAGIICAVLLRSQPTTFQSASLDFNRRERAVPAPPSASLTRALGREAAAAPIHASVRFAPNTPISHITALLDRYQASIVDGAKGGLFTLRLGNRPMAKEDADSLIARLQREEIIDVAQAAP